MLHNLLAEMKRKNIKQTEMAEAININTKSMYNKLYGETQFTAREVLAIKETFFPELEIEYLFKQDSE